MTRDELYTLVWSMPVTEAALLVGMSGNGLAKACRRHGVQVPPRGYWQRLAAGQIIEPAPPPENGHLETGVHLVASRRPARNDATAKMLQRRAADDPLEARSEERVRSSSDVDDECARILEQGLRHQLRNAAGAYLAGIAEAIPTLDDITARAATRWVGAVRVALAVVGPAEEAAEALRARAGRHESAEAWLSTLVHGRPAAAIAPRRRRTRRTAARASEG